LARNAIRFASQHVLDTIEQLQPFHGDSQRILWELHQLDIRDKHRLLLVTLPSITYWRRELRTFNPASQQWIDTNKYAASNDLIIPKLGLRVDRLPADIFPEGLAHIRYNLKNDLVIDELGIFKTRKLALPTLHDYGQAVIAVLGVFEPLFPPTAWPLTPNFKP
jgi:hypothetical protein